MCVCWSSVPLWLDHFLGMFPPSFTHSIIDIVGDTLKSEPLGFLLVFLRCFSFVICTFFYPLLALFGSFPLFFFFTVIVFFCCCSVSWLHDLCFLLQRVFFSSWLHTRDGYMKTNARWTSGEDTLLPLNCVFFWNPLKATKAESVFYGCMELLFATPSVMFSAALLAWSSCDLYRGKKKEALLLCSSWTSFSRNAFNFKCRTTGRWIT